jgi:hypothetical protein
VGRLTNDPVRLRAAHFCLLLREGEASPEDRIAVWYAPYDELRADEILDTELAAQANSRGCLERHRIAIRSSFDFTNELDLALFAGLLRHEVEHARQWTLGGGPELFSLDGVAVTTALTKKAEAIS